MSWWMQAPRDGFTLAATAQGFRPVNGLCRTAKPRPVDDQRGKHVRFSSADTTHCAVCPRALTQTEQKHGLRRCHRCRRARVAA